MAEDLGMMSDDEIGGEGGLFSGLVVQIVDEASEVGAKISDTFQKMRDKYVDFLHAVEEDKKKSLEKKGTKSSLDDIASSAKKVADQMDRAYEKAMKWVQTAAAVVGITGLTLSLKELYKVGTEVEHMFENLANITGSESAASGIISWADKLQYKLPILREQLLSTAESMSKVGYEVRRFSEEHLAGIAAGASGQGLQFKDAMDQVFNFARGNIGFDQLQGQFNALNPLLIQQLAAIPAVGEGVYKRFEIVSNAMAKSYEGNLERMEHSTATMVGRIKAIIGEFWRTVAGGTQEGDLFSEFRHILSDISHWFVDHKDTFMQVASTIGQAIKTVVHEVYSLGKLVAGTLGDLVKSIFGDQGEGGFVQNTLRPLVTYVAILMTQVRVGIESSFPIFVEFASILGGLVGDALKKSGEGFKLILDGLDNLMKWVTGKDQGLIQNFFDVFNKGLGAVTLGVKSFILMVRMLPDAMDLLAARNKMDFLESKATRPWSTEQDLLNLNEAVGNYEAIKRNLSSAWGFGQEKLNTAYQEKYFTAAPGEDTRSGYERARDGILGTYETDITRGYVPPSANPSLDPRSSPRSYTSHGEVDLPSSSPRSSSEFDIFFKNLLRHEGTTFNPNDPNGGSKFGVRQDTLNSYLKSSDTKVGGIGADTAKKIYQDRYYDDVAGINDPAMRSFMFDTNVQGGMQDVLQRILDTNETGNRLIERLNSSQDPNLLEDARVAREERLRRLAKSPTLYGGKATAAQRKALLDSIPRVDSAYEDAKRYGQQFVMHGDIVINTPSGDPAKIARELLPALDAAMRERESRGGKVVDGVASTPSVMRGRTGYRSGRP